MEAQPKPFVAGYPAAPMPPYLGAGASTTATAYTYPAAPYYPPPGPYYNPNTPYNLSSSNANVLYLRRFIICCISFFLVVGLATFVLWLVLRPRLPEFSVTSASASSFYISGGQQLSADFNLTFSVRNSNKKMEISYDKVEAAVFYGSEPVADTTMPPFYQEAGNSTAVSPRFATLARYIDLDMARDLTEEKSGTGGVRFNVRLLALVKFRAGAWRTRLHEMRVFCPGVMIRFSNATATVGSLMGQAIPCQVDL